MILTFTVLVLGIVLFMMLAKTDKASPIFLFVAIWTSIIFLYQLKLYGIYDVSDYTQVVILVGVLSFVFGYFLMSCFYKPIYTEKNIALSDINTNAIKILIVLVFLASAPFYFTQLKMMFSLGGTLDVLKIMLVTGETSSGGIVMQYFVRPMEYIIVAISAFFLMYNNKEKFIIISGIAFSVLKLLSTGSKASLVFYALAVFTIYVSKNKKIIRDKKNKKAKYMIGVMIIAVLLYMAMNGNIFKSLYYYLCGCIPMLEKVLVTETAFYGTEATYGFLSFNGLFRFIFNVLEMFGITVNSRLFDLGYRYIGLFEYSKIVGDNTRYNAFTTLFAYFHIDFGIIGVFVMSFLFGVVAYYIYKKAICTKKLNWYVLFILVNYSVVFSMVRFQVANTVIACAFIYAIVVLNIVLYSKNKIKFK